MKKQPNRFIFSFLGLLLIGITFVSCEAEKDFVQESDGGKQMRRVISFQQFKNEIGQPRFGTGMSLSLSANARNMEDFDIDTTQVKSLQNNYLVYSMKLDPKFVPEDSKFYNLFVYKDNTDEIVKQIIEIMPQTELTDQQTEGIYNYLNTANKEVIYSSKTMYQSPICVGVVMVDVCTCGPEHPREANCNCQTFHAVAQIQIMACPSYGSPPPDAPEPNIENPDQNNQEGGGGSVSGEPVLPSLDGPNPCGNMRNLFSPLKSNIKSKIQTLQATLNQSGENGVYLRKFQNGSYSSPQAPPTILNSINPQIGSTFYGFMHTHPFNTYPMFSWSDVMSMHQIAQYTDPNNIQEVASILVCKDDTGFINLTYAISFSSETANTIDNLYGQEEFLGCEPNKVTQIYDDMLKERYDNDPSYERDFLRQTYGFNISLYKANATLTGWNKLIYDPVSNLVKTIPCN
ncbi:hypothetical protein [Flavobacterium sp.]|uniref:hypothetical protein n=1 Tax=Flavobacterium sp. TaxID=239 RepID=UPI0025EDDEB4|nr:hypothetical protein [Flavobacterium sp.]